MENPNIPIDRPPVPLECRVTGGFSSRLKALASAAVWAIQRVHTTVHILWLAEFDTFAAPAFSVFDLSALPYWYTIQDAPFLPHTGWLSARPIPSEDAMNAYVDAMGGKPLRIMSGSQYSQTMFMIECARMFKPSLPIDAAVTAAFAQVIGRTLVGIHFRRGQATLSPASSFWTTMKEIVAATPAVLFYVAADDPSFVEAAQIQFPDNTTVGFKQAIDPNNPEGNEQAAIDFFALAKTTRIFGSTGSGFGLLAAQYGGIDYLEVPGVALPI